VIVLQIDEQAVIAAPDVSDTLVGDLDSSDHMRLKFPSCWTCCSIHCASNHRPAQLEKWIL